MTALTAVPGKEKMMAGFRQWLHRSARSWRAATRRRVPAAVLAPGIAALALCMAAAAAPAAAPPQYAIVDLDIVPNPVVGIYYLWASTSTSPNSINASGVIAGTAGGQAALSDLTGTHPLDGVNASGLNAWGLNDLGQVLVRSATGNFLYYGGAMRPLGAVNGQEWWQNWWAVAINNAGQVVGTNGLYVGRDPYFSPLNVLWWYGTTTDLGDFIPAAINDAGQIAGSVPYDPNLIHENMAGLTRRAALWQGGTVKDLGVLPGEDASQASGINASGQMVGYSYYVRQGFGNPFNPHAFVYDGGAMHDLGTLGGTNGYGGQPMGYGGSASDSDSRALGINDAGQIVGSSNAPGGVGVTHAFLAQWAPGGGVMIDLNNLLPANSGWVLNEADAINNAGQIVGFGSHNGQKQVPFLLTFPDDPRVAPLAGPAPPLPAPLAPPAAPSGLAVKTVSTSELDLAWTDNGTHEQAFEVQVATGPTAAGWRNAGMVAASTPTFASTGLQSYTHYTYRVRAWNPAGASDWSNEASGDTGIRSLAAISAGGGLDFGSQPLGTPSGAQSVTVTNQGNGPLDISSITVTGGSASEFAVVPAVTMPQTLAPGASLPISLVFTPAGAGPRSATLTIAHNAPGGSSTVSLTGSGVGAVLQLTPGALDFGAEPVGLNGTLAVLLQNTGNAPMTIGKIAFKGAEGSDFSLATDDVTGRTLQPGGITLLNVRFSPTATGSRSAALAILADSNGGQQLLPLTGFGTEPLLRLSADSLLFAVQPAGAAQSLTLTNNGDAPLAIQGLALTGPDAGSFHLVSDSGEKSLDPGQSRTLTISFSPATVAGLHARIAAVSYKAALEIQHNDPHPDAPHTVTLFASTDAGAAGNPPQKLPPTSQAPTPPPAAPTGLSAQAASPGEIDLYWTDPNGGHADAFALWRKEGSGDWHRVGLVAPSVTQFADRGLAAGVSYTYRVRATTGNLASDWSGEVTALTAPLPPAAPNGLGAVVVSPTEIDLSWTHGAGDETAIAVFRQSGAGTWQRIAEVKPTDVGFADRTVQPGVSYRYRVRTHDNTQVSVWSNEAPAATPGALAAGPTNLTASVVSPSEIDLTWTAGGTGATGLAIWRRAGSGSWERIGVVKPGITQYADRSVQAGVSYRYRVRAHSSSAVSAWTNEVSGLTPPGP
jgi:probable HAF family extracellular repeat protein